MIVFVCGENDLTDKSSVKETFKQFKQIIKKANNEGAILESSDGNQARSQNNIVKEEIQTI